MSDMTLSMRRTTNGYLYRQLHSACLNNELRLEMSNAMKYIKSLEAAGFERGQAEAQVQMVLDAIEGDLATKNDLLIFQERIDGRLLQFQQQVQQHMQQSNLQVQSQLTNLENRFDRRFLQTEFRLITRLGFLVVSTTTIAVTLLVWLIKI